MTDPASIAEEDYDEHDWYVAKSLPSAFNDYATGYLACTDKTPTNAIRIAHADTHLAAMAIVDALNTAEARDADYLDLFAHVFELKKQCAALMHERDMARSALDAALELHADVATLEAAVSNGFFTEICVDGHHRTAKFRTIAQAAEWVRSQEG